MVSFKSYARSVQCDRRVYSPPGRRTTRVSFRLNFIFARRKEMKKTSLLKFVGALLITVGALFTPSTLFAREGPIACLRDGVACRPGQCCNVCNHGVCRPPIME